MRCSPSKVIWEAYPNLSQAPDTRPLDSLKISVYPHSPQTSVLGSFVSHVWILRCLLPQLYDYRPLAPQAKTLVSSPQIALFQSQWNRILRPKMSQNQSLASF